MLDLCVCVECGCVSAQVEAIFDRNGTNGVVAFEVSGEAKAMY